MENESAPMLCLVCAMHDRVSQQPLAILNRVVSLRREVEELKQANDRQKGISAELARERTLIPEEQVCKECPRWKELNNAKQYRLDAREAEVRVLRVEVDKQRAMLLAIGALAPEVYKQVAEAANNPVNIETEI